MNSMHGQSITIHEKLWFQTKFGGNSSLAGMLPVSNAGEG
jgi:hypothetical protein